jgi:hypothetical protein
MDKKDAIKELKRIVQKLNNVEDSDGLFVCVLKKQENTDIIDREILISGLNRITIIGFLEVLKFDLLTPTTRGEPNTKD